MCERADVAIATQCVDDRICGELSNRKLGGLRGALLSIICEGVFSRCIFIGNVQNYVTHLTVKDTATTSSSSSV